MNVPVSSPVPPAEAAAVPASGSRESPEAWNLERARLLYGIDGWSEGYFSVSPDGEVTADIVDREDGRRLSVSLKQVAQQLEARGINPPILLRFPFILESRIETLNEGFRHAIAELGYQAPYRGVFPIKVNQQQQVLEEVSEFGGRFHYGLEAGSKPELIAALAHLKDPEALLVCNGYKDREFIDLALHGQMMGLSVILVLEMPHELDTIIERAEALGVEPSIGIRAKLSTEGEGYWAGSAGERSPFGLDIAQLMQVVDRLRAMGKLDWLHMLHCHQGSQIPDLTKIRDTAEEAARIYAELVAEGAPMGLLNLGGGLAVDYDGAKSSSRTCSSGYSIAEYCEILVDTVQTVVDQAGVPHPALVTESGRAVTAHYSALIFKILDVNHFECRIDGDVPGEDAAEALLSLYEIANGVSPSNLLESHDKAFRYRQDIRELFLADEINLRDRARAEQLFWGTLTKIAQHARKLAIVPQELRHLDLSLADHYYGNFSIFQSLPDSWAIKQLFPVMPLHRLNEAPTRSSIINDLTCDCDGMLKSYTAHYNDRLTLPLHEIEPGDDYYVGAFLVGAYQETLSDFHNLFGDTHAICVDVVNGRAQFKREVDGDAVADVLGYVEHDPKQLVENFRRLAESAVSEGRITPTQRRIALEAYRAGLASYTYFQS